MHVVVKNLSVSYGEHLVLQNLNLTVQQLCTLTLLGSSGTGKSTFLRVLSGLPKREGQRIKGSMLIDGTNATEFLTTGRIGFMFQEPSLFPHLTVAENVRLPLKLRKADWSYADHLIERVGLSQFRDHLPRQLSGGMRTRVALARTLAPRPGLLLLDEPFSSLDIAWRFRLYRELKSLQAEIPTITILVTHDIQEALLLSNRILVLGLTGEFVRDLTVPSLPRELTLSNPLEHLKQEFQQLHDYFVNEESNSNP